MRIRVFLCLLMCLFWALAPSSNAQVVIDPFTTFASSFPSAFAGWGFRQAITVDATKVPSDRSNYPVYVDLSDLNSDFFTNVKSDGSDIRVTTSDGETEVPREVVFITTGSSIGELHFKSGGTDSLSGSTDTLFYIYYGNSSATEPARTAANGRDAVWSPWTSVYHMQDSDPGINVENSTVASTYDLADVGTLVSGDSVAGLLVGQGIQFENSKLQGLFVNGSQVSGYPFSIVGKVYLATGGSSGTIGWVGDKDSVNYTYRILILGTGEIYMEARNTTTDAHQSPLTYLDQWVHVTAVWKSATSRIIYVNGSSVSTDTSNVAYSSNIDRFSTGYTARSSPSNYGDVKLDEIRVVDSELVADWVTTSYNNHNSPSTFYSVGTTETN